MKQVQTQACLSSPLTSKSSIVGVSFGETRDFVFKKADIVNKNKKNSDKNIKNEICVKVIKMCLNNGSMYVIKHPTNDEWYHELPKRKNIKNARISLTFRNMIIN